MYSVDAGYLWWANTRLGLASTIYVDGRQQGVVEACKEVEGFQVKQLAVGDYVFVTGEGKIVGIEEKRGDDLEGSWQSRRLQRQLRHLIGGVDIPVLGFRAMDEQMAWGYMLGPNNVKELALDLVKWEVLGGISVWLPPRPEQVLGYLQELKAVLRPKAGLLSVVAGRDTRPVPDMPRLAVSLHKIVPGIGPVLGKKLAGYYGEWDMPLIAALNAPDEEWRELGANKRVLENRKEVVRGR